MMNFKKYRNHIYLTLLIYLVVLFFLAMNTWNSFIKAGGMINLGWFILYNILLLLIGYLIFRFTNNFFDEKKIDFFIESLRNDERKKVEKEFNVKFQTEAVEEDEKKISIQQSIDEMIPELKGIKSLESLASKILDGINNKIEIVAALFYIRDKKNIYKVLFKYAYTGEMDPPEFIEGETLPGQAAKSKEIICIDEIPEKYYTIQSGLGKSKPKNLVFYPIIHNKKTIAVIEMALFQSFSDELTKIFGELSLKLGERISKFIGENKLR